MSQTPTRTTPAPRKAAISPRHHADGPSWTACRDDCVTPTPFQAHCPATGCHRTFGGVSGFDKHRKDGHCVDPTTLGMVPQPRHLAHAARRSRTCTAGGVAMSDDTRREAVEAAAEATERHHIEFGKTDAMGNNPCACGQWWDTADGPGWDEHMAEAAYDAIEPLVRRAVAEGIADSLREHYDADEDRVRFGDWESCSDQCPGVLMDYVLKLVEDVAIVRQVGMHEREEAGAQ